MRTIEEYKKDCDLGNLHHPWLDDPYSDNVPDGDYLCIVESTTGPESFYYVEWCKMSGGTWMSLDDAGFSGPIRWVRQYIPIYVGAK